MLHVDILTPEEIETLEHMHKYHPRHAPRMRAHMILMSHQGRSIFDIQIAYPLCRQTISSCLRAWDKYGICGLFDKQRSGRPRKLLVEQEYEVIEFIKENPRSLKAVIAEIASKFDIEIHVSPLKRLCKNAGLSCKRIRKSLKYKRDPERYAQSKKELEGLIQQAKEGVIDLYYFDESGFTLEPCMPYAWQKKVKQLKFQVQKAKD
jgi:transposase